jgi:hypothetical protein
MARYYPRGLALLDERRLERRKLTRRLEARQQELRAHEHQIQIGVEKIRKIDGALAEEGLGNEQLRDLEDALAKERQEVRKLRKEAHRMKQRVDKLGLQLYTVQGSRVLQLAKKVGRLRTGVLKG